MPAEFESGVGALSGVRGLFSDSLKGEIKGFFSLALRLAL